MHIYKYAKENKILDVNKIKSIRKEEYKVKNTACSNTSNCCVLNVQMLAMLAMFLIHKGRRKETLKRML